MYKVLNSDNHKLYRGSDLKHFNISTLFVSKWIEPQVVKVVVVVVVLRIKSFR